LQRPLERAEAAAASEDPAHPQRKMRTSMTPRANADRRRPRPAAMAMARHGCSAFVGSLLASLKTRARQRIVELAADRAAAVRAVRPPYGPPGRSIHERNSMASWLRDKSFESPYIFIYIGIVLAL
jgi:hypothetical protein